MAILTVHGRDSFNWSSSPESSRLGLWKSWSYLDNVLEWAPNRTVAIYGTQLLP